ncbi:MAG: hypothetical protein JRJ34_09575 [Deltaproteobacteria bacterium]|nr:hypothetical protein [Deltaproteobacteria bacterium]MBW1826683.1 hypothetical protein [Deltaproteobacteria bacterium]
MYNSKLESNGSEKYLKVFYDARIDDFNSAIKAALLKHKVVRGSIPILCLPKKVCVHGLENPASCSFCQGGVPTTISRGGPLPAWLKGGY